MKYILFFVLCLAPITGYAQTIYPAGVSPTEEIKDLRFHRRTVGKFTILSIDDGQGEWIANNIESIKKWSLDRWGFPDISFSHECRIMCVPNKDMLKKLFNITESKSEVRRNAQGQIEISAVWISLDEKPAAVIPPHLTTICLAELESSKNIQLGWWVKRGVGLLNYNNPEIKKQLSLVNSLIAQDKAIFWSDALLNMKEEDYLKQSEDQRKIYDAECVALCLLLRKEFGELKFQGFTIISRNNPEQGLNLVYGFKGYSEFDKTFNRYMKDLSKELTADKIPVSYLEIKKAGE